MRKLITIACPKVLPLALQMSGPSRRYDKAWHHAFPKRSAIISLVHHRDILLRLNTNTRPNHVGRRCESRHTFPRTTLSKSRTLWTIGSKHYPLSISCSCASSLHGLCYSTTCCLSRFDPIGPFLDSTPQRLDALRRLVLLIIHRNG